MRRLWKEYGIGLEESKRICRELGVSISNEEWTKREKRIVKRYLEMRGRIKERSEGAINNNLKYIVSKEIKEWIRIKHYKGIRHKNGLAVRGQRTSTNMKTIRRNRTIPKWE